MQNRIYVVGAEKRPWNGRGTIRRWHSVKQSSHTTQRIAADPVAVGQIRAVNALKGSPPISHQSESARFCAPRVRKRDPQRFRAWKMGLKESARWLNSPVRAGALGHKSVGGICHD